MGKWFGGTYALVAFHHYDCLTPNSHQMTNPTDYNRLSPAGKSLGNRCLIMSVGSNDFSYFIFLNRHFLIIFE